MTLVRCCHVQIWVEEVTKTIYNRAFEKNHLHAIVVWRLYFKLLPFVKYFFPFLVLVFSISCSKVSLTLWLIAAEATFWYFYVATPLSRERLSCHLWIMWSPAKRKGGSELWWLDSPPFDLWSNHNPCFTLTNRPFLEHRGTSNHNISCHHKIGKNVQCSIQNPIANILKHFLAFPNSFVAKSCRYFICWEVFGDQLALVKNSSILLALFYSYTTLDIWQKGFGH